MPEWIDLDANATTRPLPEVVEVVARHLRETWGNPGSRHALGRRARRVLEESRESIAAILGAHPDELIFTSGGTEANNAAIFGLVRGKTGTILHSPGEHPSSLEACRVLQARGYVLQPLAVDEDGKAEGGRRKGEGGSGKAEGGRSDSGFSSTSPFPLPSSDVPRSAPALLALILAHNETGVIQDVAPWAEWCREQQVPLHLDGVQAVGKIPVNFHELGATSLSFGAHKFHGPRGVGGLLLRKGTRFTPLTHGGHQEQEKRPGTEAVPLIAGMSKALELWQADRESRTRHLELLRDHLQAGLVATSGPVVINAASAKRLPNTLNIAFPGLDGEALLVALDLAGICCSLGTTCASGSTEPAPILVAMGCPPDVYRASVRFSVSVLNTLDEIDEAVRRIRSVVETQRRLIQAQAAQ